MITYAVKHGVGNSCNCTDQDKSVTKKPNPMPIDKEKTSPHFSVKILEAEKK